MQHLDGQPAVQAFVQEHEGVPGQGCPPRAFLKQPSGTTLKTIRAGTDWQATACVASSAGNWSRRWACESSLSGETESACMRSRPSSATNVPSSADYLSCRDSLDFGVSGLPELITMRHHEDICLSQKHPRRGTRVARLSPE
jgi:hypothetical protein